MTAPTTTPSAIRNATLAVWAILVLVVLRVILTFAMSDALVDAWIESNESAKGLPREIVAEGAPKYGPIAIGILVIGVVLALAAVNLPKGKQWARVVVYVFASLNIIGILLSFLRADPGRADGDQRAGGAAVHRRHRAAVDQGGEPPLRALSDIRQLTDVSGYPPDESCAGPKRRKQRPEPTPARCGVTRTRHSGFRAQVLTIS